MAVVLNVACAPSVSVKLRGPPAQLAKLGVWHGLKAFAVLVFSMLRLRYKRRARSSA